MTDRIDDGCSLIKADRLGRARFTQKQRDAFLDAYEEGALSGPQFAKVHGLKYQTFASWRQKRTRQQNSTESPPPSESTFNLVEVGSGLVDPTKAVTPDTTLKIRLSGGAILEVSDPASAKLAAEVLVQLHPKLTQSC